MKSSKAQIQAKYHKIPVIRFEDQKLTSFSGLLIFQVLFGRLKLKQRLKKCFAHLKVSPIFGRHLVVLLLIVHLLLGFRRLREVDYYRDDPIVLRLMGLRKLPDVSTISRALSQMENDGIEKVRELSRSLVIDGLKREKLPRLTFDFDGSVQSTKGHAEGTAVGFNKNKKGARSYYPLFCTVAQTDQLLDVHHRPGNVHDSNGADQFMMNCFGKAKEELKNTVFESRIDSAFFNQKILSILDSKNVKFTASVPFERFTQLKDMIEQRKRWRTIDRQWSYFETKWKPKSWNTSYRFIFTRKKTKRQHKGPLQLDLFEPHDFNFDYKVIVTNKSVSAKSTVQFHNGRGTQEAIFGNAKTDAGLCVIPTRRLAGNQIYTLCSMMAHNLSREIKMLASPRAVRSLPKRPAVWSFEKLDTLRHRIIQRAGRLVKPKGKLTLTMSANQAVRKNMSHFLDVLQKAA
ncbi:MAG: IS1380 family transposase [Desulfobacterales bacterium]|nr:IS1380 family transposase [Desulfobacterales bacterium]MDP6808224.1 IS1380 family transposase [Desulfobacterales bacterium]